MSISREDFENLKKFPFYKGRVVTDSMSPILKVGEEISIKVGQKDLKRFDIVVVFIDGKLLCHYLWNMNKVVKPILLQTRNIHGHLDFPVGEEDYLGKVVSHKISFFWKLKLLF